MAYNELKYRERFTTSVDKNLLKEFRELAEKRRQPLSWLTEMKSNMGCIKIFL